MTLKEKAAKMREVIGDIEGALYGCDTLIDLRDTFEDDEAPLRYYGANATGLAEGLGQ